VKLADCGFEAARAVVAAAGRRVTAPLPPAAVLAVHTEGESAFEGMGRRYPARFVDIDIGRWRELTGEDD
jgi:hypothetical protein